MTTPQGFTTHSGSACPLDSANVDTDQIIPKQFLTSVSRQGFGKNLFFDWRYLKGDNTQPNPDFVLNDPRYKTASILLTRENFGCGSSREHAPWALADYGFRVIIATSFADIFYGNCINNQLLPVQLTSSEIECLFAIVEKAPSSVIHIDLESQTVTCEEHTFSFSISAAHKFTLQSGLDDIGQTLLDDEKIAAFEQTRPAWQ